MIRRRPSPLGPRPATRDDAFGASPAMIEAMTNLPLTHLVRRPLDVSASPPMLVLLHGYGSNEQDLFALAPYLDERFLIVSPRAPYTLSPGYYAWFNLEVGPGGITVDEAEAVSSRPRLIQFIRAAAEAYGADPQRIYLAGFSQGATMSLGVMLAAPDSVAGVVAMSGFLLPAFVEQAAPDGQFAGLPVLVVHGEEDELVPVTRGRECRDVLSRLPVALAYREYPMRHQISDESLDDVSQWLSEALERQTADGRRQTADAG